MGVKFPAIKTLKEAKSYAVAGIAASKKSCPKATALYAKAANAASHALGQKENYSDTSGITPAQFDMQSVPAIKVIIAAANKVCDGQRKAKVPSAPPVDKVIGPTVPVDTGGGTLAFMNKLPGPKWAYFIGAGLVGTALIFPTQTKDAFKKIGF